MDHPLLKQLEELIAERAKLLVQNEHYASLLDQIHEVFDLETDGISTASSKKVRAVVDQYKPVFDEAAIDALLHQLDKEDTIEVAGFRLDKQANLWVVATGEKYWDEYFFHPWDACKFLWRRQETHRRMWAGILNADDAFLQGGSI